VTAAAGGAGLWHAESVIAKAVVARQAVLKKVFLWDMADKSSDL